MRMVEAEKAHSLFSIIAHISYSDIAGEQTTV